MKHINCDLRIKKSLQIVLLFIFLFDMYILSFAAHSHEVQRLNVQQVRILARDAALSGNLEVADELSSALLRADPNDAFALLVRASVSKERGNFDDALDAATKAFRNTDSRVLRFDAAILAADVLTRQKRYTRAQIWLRRADHIAPDERRTAFVERFYRQVSRRNPLSVQLRFSVRPSSNVNNGADTDIIEIGGLPFRIDESGLKLGGYEAESDLFLSYRLSGNQTQRTEIFGSLFNRRVVLDSKAKKIAPEASGSDYSYDAIVGGIRHDRLIWPDVGPTRITALAGYRWYGGDPLSHWSEMRLQQTFVAPPRALYRLGASLRLDDRLDDPINDSTTVRLTAETVRTLESGKRYSFGLSVTDVSSDAATIDTLSWGLSAKRDFGRIGPIEPSISLFAETSDFRKWQATSGGREDVSLSLSLSASWPDIRYYGFVPELSLGARRTWSDVDIYDREELSLGLTAKSRF